MVCFRWSYVDEAELGWKNQLFRVTYFYQANEYSNKVTKEYLSWILLASHLTHFYDAIKNARRHVAATFTLQLNQIVNEINNCTVHYLLEIYPLRNVQELGEKCRLLLNSVAELHFLLFVSFSIGVGEKADKCYKISILNWSFTVLAVRAGLVKYFIRIPPKTTGVQWKIFQVLNKSIYLRLVHVNLIFKKLNDSLFHFHVKNLESQLCWQHHVKIVTDVIFLHK